MTTIPTIDTLEVEGTTVLVRSDLNVPLDEGLVGDDYRIAASLPTIHELLARGARVVVCSHLGRPVDRERDLRMDAVAERLGDLGSFPVVKVDAVYGDDASDTVTSVDPSTVVVLENTRFESGEVTNDGNVAAGLASLADLFVLDAFGTAHRAHASTVGVADILPSAAGRLLESELGAFDRLDSDGSHPYVVVLGGAKISDKLGLIERLLPQVDLMLVGGGMCFTLLAAAGYEVGGSLVDESIVAEVGQVLDSDTGGKILLPDDLVVGDRFGRDAETSVRSATGLRKGDVGMDIGPETVSRFESVIANAARVFWNGPMGVFEWPAFRSGTSGIVDAVARCTGFTVVGGGDSVAAIRILGRDADVSHLSTGGGVGLAMLEGRKLPAVEALRKWSNA